LLSIIGLKTRTEGEIWLNEERIDPDYRARGWPPP
jgi:hypothetical protein